MKTKIPKFFTVFIIISVFSNSVHPMIPCSATLNEKMKSSLGTSGVDLYFIFPIKHPEEIVLGEEAEIEFTIGNRGDERAIAFVLALHIHLSNKLIETLTKPLSIGSHQVVRVKMQWKPSGKGYYTLTAVLDFYQKYLETNENNNLADFHINVSEPVEEEIEAVPSEPVEEETTPEINFIADISTVKNLVLTHGTINENHDEEAIELLNRNFNLIHRRDIDTELRENLNIIVLGGPLVNLLAWKYNWVIDAYFHIDEKRFTLKLNKQLFKLDRRLFSRMDYALIAYKEYKGANIWFIEGFTRHGTLAATLYLTYYPNKLKNKKVIVLQWIDVDGDKTVSAKDWIAEVYSHN